MLPPYPMHTTAVPPPPAPRRAPPRGLGLAVSITAMVWYFAAAALATSASQGLASQFANSDVQPLLEALILLFLVVVGLAFLRVLDRSGTRGRAPLRITLGLPRRATAAAEWGLGAALGWGIAVAAVLPMALARALNTHLWTTPRAFMLLGLSLLTLAVATLAKDVGIHGYALQRMVEALGPTRATLLMALLSAVYSYRLGASSASLVASVLVSVLLSLCWLRTHAVWLLWGLHFASAASTGVLFGLPLGGDASFSSLVETRAYGPTWLTGGYYGPAGALTSILLLLVAIPILVRTTSDYAWNYTHPPLIPGGYDVTIPPPAAHVAMEQGAVGAQPVNPASLVQILPTTPRTPTAGTSTE